MISERLSEFIANPESIKETDAPFLESIIRKYPFFQIAHVLLLVSLKKGDCEKFNLQLRSSAVHIPDRHKLYNILFGGLTNSDDLISETQQHQLLLSDETVEFQFDNSKPEFTIDKTAENIVSEKQENIQELLEIDENTVGIFERINPIPSDMPSEKDSNTMESSNNNGFSLIEKFIEESPVFTPNKLTLDEPRADISLPSVEEDDTLVTETLATVFEMQKLYEKAIGVYEKLILKFPEKSAYFASRITELKEKNK